MKKSFTCFSVLLFAITFHYQVSAQSFTTKGKLFWLGFMENYYVPETRVYISSDVPTTGTVSIPLQGWVQNFTVTPGVSTMINIPVAQTQAVGSNVIQPNGVRIQSAAEVSAFMINYAQFTSDASLVLPIQTLGDEYFVTAHKDANTFSDVSELMIVAAYDNSTFEITPSVNSISGQTAGVPFQINMNAGQTYQLQSDFDLSGTFIRSVNNGAGCKKFAVYGGNRCTGVDCPYCDHLVDQMYPNNTLGQNYVLPHLIPRGYTKFRVVATKNGTQFSVNGGPVQNLNAGQHTIFNLSANGFLSSNEPVSVMQYSIGNDCDPQNLGDPFMILMSPVEQLLDQVTFTAISSPVVTNYYLLVTTKTANTALVTLDGAGIAASFVPVPSNPAFSVASLNITQGDHTLQSDSGFLAYTYAYGADESYGYSAGANLSNLYAQLTYASTDFDTIVCPGDTILFVGVGDTSIISYEWDFGDGSTAVGKNTSHTFASLGTYEVKMIIERFNACEKDTLTDSLKVLGPIVTNVDDDTICVGGSATFTANGGDNYFWSTGATTQSVTLSPPVTTVYSVYATVSSCSGIPDSFAVTVIDPQLSITWLGTCLDAPFSFFPVSSTSAILNYAWDFGDGSTDTVYNPSHTFANAGTYNVNVSILTVWGCTVDADTQFVVDAVPNPDFTFADACNGTAMQLNNTTTGGTFNSLWYFGDNDSSNVLSPSHLYADTGTYNVTLIASAASNNACRDTISKDVRVNLQPMASFVASNECLGDSIAFTNSSMQNTDISFLWSFGDGQSSNLFSPTYNYTLADTFSVQLIASTIAGCSDTATLQIVVYPKPSADFNVDDECLGSTTILTNLSAVSSGTFTNNWNFGDGTSSTLSNPSHTYADTATYSIELIVTSDNNCTDTSIKTTTVHFQPTAAFSAAPICAGGASVFTNLSSQHSSEQYLWLFGDSNNSTAANPTHTYLSDSVWTVTLIASTNFGCADTSSGTAEVYSIPVPDFSVTDVCDGTAADFTNNSSIHSGSYSNNWNFGDGNSSNSVSPGHLYTSTGTYNVELVLISNNNCADSLTKTIEVLFQPQALFTVQDVCDGVPAQFQNNSVADALVAYIWNFGNNQSSNLQNPTHTFANDGVFSVSLVAYNTACADTMSASVTIYPNPLPAISATDNCLGIATSFQNNSSISSGTVSSWLWSFGDGNVSNNYIPTHIYSAAGTYNVQLNAVSDFGCEDSANTTVTIYPLPTATYSSTLACFAESNGTTTVLPAAGTSPYTVEWSTGAAGESIENVFAGSYTYTVTDANNCTFTSAAVVSQQPYPVILTLADTIEIDLGESATIQVSGNYDPYLTYQWTPTEYLNCSNCQSNTINPLQSITYTIDAVDTLGCAGSATVFVLVNPEHIVFVPNIFTPNSDGANDVFYVYSKAVKQFQLQLFNRWGELVFESNNLSDGWDGTYKGEVQPNGVYVYTIQIVYLDNYTRNDMKGSVTLVR
jgi:gliding motility-associated-like protein